MASKAMAMPSEDNWQARNDHDTLERACQIMADRIRMRAVLTEHNRQKVADQHLTKLLAGHRSGRLRRLKGY